MTTAIAVLPRLAPRETRDGELRRARAAELVAQQPRAAIGDLGALTVVAALLWPVAPHALLMGWAGGVVATVAIRTAAGRSARRALAPDAMLPMVRLAAIAVALAWGLGTAVAVPDLPSEYLALLLLVLGGLSAAAAGTLAADPLAFNCCLAATFVPPTLALLAHAPGRFQVAVTLLLAGWAGLTSSLHRQGHKSLLERLDAGGLLRGRERESRGERALLNALFGHMPNAAAVIDSEGRFVRVNAGFETTFGFTAQEVLGRSLIDMLVPEAGREAAFALQQQVWRGETVTVESERRCKDGRLATVQLSAMPFEVEGATMMVFLYTEVTAIRQAEAELRAAQARLEQVLASSTAVIYVTRVEGASFTPIWVSENLTRITGYESEEALDPAWWVDRLHPDDRAGVFAGLRRLLSEDHLTTEYRFRPKDGDYRWMHDESRLTRDASGKPLEIFGAWLDITDRKLAEEAMREARDLAERAARTQAAFLANMSHEIRTPMNAVLGMTELLLDTELSAYQQRSLGIVRSAGESLLALLNDILDFSKIEAEHLTLESTSFDLRYLLESTTSLLAARTTDRVVELAADVAADIPHLVRGDPTRLRQVLTNLVGNGLKFTHAGEVVLSATSVPGPDGTARIRFAVRDTGIGIPQAQLATIFDEFVQADASMTRRYGGTGLGLAISRRLVALMGGELTVASDEGRGSEFAFTLCLPIDTAQPAPPADQGRLVGARVLVVDDNATTRRVVREMLVTASVAVDEAATADSGLQAIREAQQKGEPYAVAIIDVQMPDRDGFELAVEVRRDPALATTRLLMLTSTGQRGDSDRCRAAGIEGYLTKPVSRGDLLEMSAALLGAPGQRQGTEPVTRHRIAESRRRLHVLLAEDNLVNQEIAAAMLRKRGHIVDVVNNGREAVAAAAGKSYHAVLMDIQMPEMDGFAATQAIRAGPAGAGLPIIALTAHALTGERERCLANGMNGYLAKPFSARDLFAVVEGIGEARTLPAETAPVSAAPVVDFESPVVDIDSFRQAMREAGAEDAVDGILEMFTQHLPGRIAALADAMNAGDTQGIARAAHAFRSPAAAIGARSLAGLLQEIELAGSDGALDRARAEFQRLRKETDAVREHLGVPRHLES